MSSEKRYLVVFATIFFGHREFLPLYLIIQANKDIFKGIFAPKKPETILDCYVIFESNDEERINNLAEAFRLIIDKLGYKAKYMVQVKKRLDYSKYNLIEDFL